MTRFDRWRNQTIKKGGHRFLVKQCGSSGTAIIGMDLLAASVFIKGNGIGLKLSIRSMTSRTTIYFPGRWASIGCHQRNSVKKKRAIADFSDMWGYIVSSTMDTYAHRLGSPLRQADHNSRYTLA